MAPIAGVVLAAGLGTRLRPLTDLRPKALCPVANVALVDMAIGHVRAVATDVAVNVHAHRDQMLAHLDGVGVHLSVEEPQPLGTAGALGRLREWIAGRPVLVHNADTWHYADLAIRLLEGWDGERMRLLAVPAEPGPGDFGDQVYAGACLLPWRDVRDLRDEPSGLYELLWRRAEQEGSLELVAYGGPWFDTGTPATYLAANLAASGGGSVISPDASVGPGAEIVRSVVWPRAVVEPGERLIDQIRAPGGVTVDAAEGTEAA